MIFNMTTNGYSSNYIKGEEFFTSLKTKSAKTNYKNLHDYIKYVAEELGEEQSFYVLNVANILWKVQLWKENFPDVTPFYAVKANADPILIRLFVLLGFSFDCSTKGEIDIVLKHGSLPKNIIYAHTIKPTSSLKYALKVGVDFMTFDSEEELLKLQQYFPTARLILRIEVETPSRLYDLSGKFGCPISNAKNLLQQAKKCHLNVVGVSFHVGALCDDPNIYTKTIENCRLIFEIAKKLGYNFSILDLGAGFFGSTIREKHFKVIAAEIKKSIYQNFPNNSVRVIAEPGCYFVGSAQRHVTCVLGRKLLNQKNNIANGYGIDDIQRHYYLNEGYYGSFFKYIELYDISPKPLLKQSELIKRPIYNSKIWGQTCCSEDVIQNECLIPEMQRGEYIVWENMGAYTQGVSSTFTLVPLPVGKHVFIKDSRLHLDLGKNYEEISNFIVENTILIDNEEFL